MYVRGFARYGAMIAGLILGLSAIGTIAYALTIDPPDGTFYACYDTGGKGAGKIKLVNEDTTCKAGTAKISWRSYEEITDFNGTHCEADGADGTLEITFDPDGTGHLTCVVPEVNECEAAANGAACDDSNVCTTGDQCTFEECVGDVIPTGDACTITNGFGSCPGTTICDPEDGVSCVGQAPTAELCDETDNDCDGNTDEGFSTGGSCTVGVGACERTGTFVCDVSGSGTECSEEPGAPTTETCNGIDDDCDGSVDEGCP